MSNLEKLLKEAAQNPMTTEEQEAQRQSWVRAMTTGCEHGVLDFEQCPDCRGPLTAGEDRG
jgi:hypothetical protein